MNGLSCGEESMTIYSAVLIQYEHVTDRRTYGRTDRRPAYIYYVLQHIADVRKKLKTVDVCHDENFHVTLYFVLRNVIATGSVSVCLLIVVYFCDYS